MNGLRHITTIMGVFATLCLVIGGLFSAVVQSWLPVTFLLAVGFIIGTIYVFTDLHGGIHE